MKKLLLIAMVLVSFTSYGQNPVKLKYEKDEFTGKEYLMTESNLLVSDDGKKGFIIYPRFKKENNKWEYSFIGGVSTVGTCFENDKIYIIFDDGSKFDMTSWRDFNCKGEIGFDLNGQYREILSKPIKGIKFQNGRDYSSFDKIFTNSNDKNYFINAFKALDAYNNKN